MSKIKELTRIDGSLLSSQENPKEGNNLAENGNQDNSGSNQTPKTCLWEDVQMLLSQEFNEDCHFHYELTGKVFVKGQDEKIPGVYVDKTWQYYATFTKVLYRECYCLVVLIKDQTDMYEIKRIKEKEKFEKNLVTSMTHDLRTPLNGIMSILNEVAGEIQNPDLANLVSIAHNTGDMMLLLINDVLDLAQIEQKKLKLNISEFNPEDVIQQIYRLMKFNYNSKGIDLQIDLYPDLPLTINTDKTRYMQILFNLLGNAFKFTEKNGSVKITLLYDSKAKVLCTAVTDTGVGISPADLPRLFTRFGKLDRTSKINPGGVGLGLNICKTLSQMLGGDIFVESELDKGSRFTFYIASNNLLVASSPSQLGKSPPAMREIDAAAVTHDYIKGLFGSPFPYGAPDNSENAENSQLEEKPNETPIALKYFFLNHSLY